MKYFFYYKIIIFIGKLIKKCLKTTDIKIKLINFSRSYDWITARVLKLRKFEPLYVDNQSY